MRKVWTLGIVLICLLWTAGACVIAVVEYDPDEGIPPTEEFRDSLEFFPGGAVTVNNVSGDIEIQGWDRDEVEIFAEKWIHQPWEPKIRVLSTDMGLPRIEVDKQEKAVRIRTRVPRGKNVGDVHYLISVPEAVELKDILTLNGNVYIHDLYGIASVETDSGNIDVDNFSGSLDVRANQGHITVRLFDMRPEDHIALRTEEGDIVLYVSPDASLQFEVEAPRGRIDTEFGSGEEPTPEGRLSFEMGSQGSRVSLSALSGNVTITAHDRETGKEKL